MKYKDVLGIDVSKKTIDVKLHCTGVHRIFNNNGNGYRSLIIWMKKQTTLDVSEILICFEKRNFSILKICSFINQQLGQFIQAKSWNKLLDKLQYYCTYESRESRTNALEMIYMNTLNLTRMRPRYLMVGE